MDYLFSDFPPSISFVRYLCISDYSKFGLPRLVLLFSYLFPIIFHFLYVPYLLADILIIKMSNAVFHFYHCFKIPKPFLPSLFKNHVIFLWMKSFFFPLNFKWVFLFLFSQFPISMWFLPSCFSRSVCLGFCLMFEVSSDT